MAYRRSRHSILKLPDSEAAEKLAVASTRMCELYLGLPERKWTIAVGCDMINQVGKRRYDQKRKDKGRLC